LYLTNKKNSEATPNLQFIIIYFSNFDCNQAKKKIAAERRKRWINAIRRDDLFQNKEKLANFLRNGRICKKHFKSGQPAHFDDRENEDWVPNMNMGYEPATDPIRVEKNTNRKERLQQRNVVKVK
jgi:hypothetical protein